MPDMPGSHAPHARFNQTPPLTDYNLFTTDAALQDAVEREGAAAHVEELARRRRRDRHGRELRARAPCQSTPAAAAELQRAGRAHRCASSFIPSWHALMQGIAARGYHSAPWVRENGRAVAGAHVGARRGLPDAGAGGMRHVVPDHHDLRCDCGHAPRLRAGARMGAAAAHPRIRSRATFPSQRKHGGLIGMGMTEKQGGSDVRANTTRARAHAPTARIASPATSGSSRPRSATRIWCSHRRGAGLSCFFMPRRLPDGTRNGISFSASRTSSATDPTPPPKSSSSTHGRSCLGEEGRGIADHPRDGHLHAARLRHRQRRNDAPRRRSGPASRTASQRLRRQA